MNTPQEATMSNVDNPLKVGSSPTSGASLKIDGIAIFPWFSIYCPSEKPDDVEVMAEFLDLIAGCKTHDYASGEIVMEQDSPSGPLLVLMEGEVEILRDDIRVSKIAQAGAVFGEMSVLLGCPHTATVRALKPSRFAVIENPLQFLTSSPDASLHVARLLAKRLDSLSKYLADVKRQYEGHDHLGMVDEVLETLMHRQPRPSVH
jgi:CRP-like cAMP-binding protein